jgi:hypothetical protein
MKSKYLSELTSQPVAASLKASADPENRRSSIHLAGRAWAAPKAEESEQTKESKTPLATWHKTNGSQIANESEIAKPMM